MTGRSQALGLYTLLMATASFGANAQEAAQKIAAETTLETVTVSARQRDESLQNLSISASVLGGRLLDQASVRSVRDIEFMVPNLVFGNTGSDGETFIGIRGVGDFSRNIGFDTRVGVYIDGVYVGQSLAINQALADVERVEVLRGPQGTLFGKNTSSGVISIVTRKPQFDFEGSIEASYGNLDNISGKAMINIPLVADKVALRVSLSGEGRDGYVDNVFNGKKLMSQDYWGGRAQLRFRPNDDLDMVLRFDINESNPNILYLEPTAEVGLGGFAQAPGIRDVAQNVDLKDEIDLWGVSFNLDYGFGDGYTLTSISSFRHADRTTVSDEDASPLDYLEVDQFEDSFDQFTHELRVASPEGGRFDYVAGLYFFHQKADSIRSAKSGPDFLGDFNLAHTQSMVETNAYAAFANGNFHLSDTVWLNGGVRVTREEKHVLFDQAARPQYPQVNLDEKQNDTAFSYTISLNWQVTDSVHLYALHAHGSKGGGWNVEFVIDPDIAFDPETVDNFEIGLKSELWDGRVRLNVSAFLSKFDDLQVFQFQDTPLGTNLVLSNAGKATAQGFEFELTALVADGFQLSAGVGFADTTFDEFKDGGGLGVDFDGNRLARAPKWTVNVSGDYTVPVTDELDLVFWLEFAYRSAHYFNPNNLTNTRSGGYGLLNSRVSLMAHAGWEIYVWGKNLTDKDYVTNRGVSFLGIPFDLYAPPRTYGVGAKASF